MRKTYFGRLAVLATVIVSLFAFLVVASTAMAADLAAAKKVYDDRCAKCHGLTGKGDGPKAKTLKKKPRDYTNAAEMGKLTDEQLKKEILDGKKPMPAFRGKIDEKTIDDLIAYVRTFAK